MGAKESREHLSDCVFHPFHDQIDDDRRTACTVEWPSFPDGILAAMLCVPKTGRPGSESIKTGFSEYSPIVNHGHVCRFSKDNRLITVSVNRLQDAPRQQAFEIRH